MKDKVMRLPKLAMASAALLGVSACGSAQKDSNSTATENVALPADETATDDAGVAAAMHNRMLDDAGNEKGSAGTGMADDQIGGGSMGNSSMSGGMSNGQMGGMMGHDMPMGGGNMTAPQGGTKGMGGKTDKPKPDTSMPMHDDM